MMGAMATLEYPETMPASDVYADRLAHTERFGAYGRVTRVVDPRIAFDWIRLPRLGSAP